MHYIDWNNVLGARLFDKANGDTPQAVLLHLTRGEIIAVGRAAGVVGDDAQIWDDYLRALKRGILGGAGNTICQQLLFICTPQGDYPAYSKRFLSQQRLDSPYILSTADHAFEIAYPPQLAYLLFFVLPLTEKSDLHAANYYDRLCSYAKKHDVQIGLQPNRQNGKLFYALPEALAECWEEIWDQVGEWSAYCAGKKHIFPKMDVPKNQRYVGWPHMQLLLNQQQLRALGKLFSAAGWLPQNEYSEQEYEEMLTAHGSVVDIDIEKIDQSYCCCVYSLLKEAYARWDGGYDWGFRATGSDSKLHSVSTGITAIPKLPEMKFRVAFRVRSIARSLEEITWGMHLETHVPEKPKALVVGRGEHPLRWIDDRTSVMLEVPEPYKMDKQCATAEGFRGTFLSEQQDCLLFMQRNGAFEQCERVSDAARVYVLLYKKACHHQVDKWVHAICETPSYQKAEQLKNIPEDYRMVLCRNIRLSEERALPSYLRLSEETEIRLEGGYAFERDTYAVLFPPRIALSGDIRPGDRVMLLSEAEEIELAKIPAYSVSTGLHAQGFDANLSFRQLLSDRILQDTAYYLAVYREKRCEVLSRKFSFRMPKLSICRDKYAAINTSGYQAQEGESGLKGLCGGVYESTLAASDSERFFKQLALPEEPSWNKEANCDKADVFLHHLSAKCRKWSKTDFMKHYSLMVTEEATSWKPYKIRELLGLYEQMGYIDILRNRNGLEYEETLVINAPSLVLLPKLGKEGRYRAILVGGRTQACIEQLKGHINAYNEAHSAFLDPMGHIELRHTHQIPEYYKKESLLPPSTYILHFDNLEGVKYLSEKMGFLLAFDTEKQVALQPWMLFSYLDPISEEYLSTPYDNLHLAGRKDRYSVFNPDTLRFEPNKPINKQCALVTYTLDAAYQRDVTLLWYQDKSYLVDKNWGRYFVLSKAGRQILHYDEQQQMLMVPKYVPLPALYARALTLLGGYHPNIEEREGVRYCVYAYVSPALFENFCCLVLGTTPAAILCV